jgi:hypothetical protein
VLSIASRTCHLGLKFPWPVWNRDAFMTGFGVNILEDGVVCVSVRSCQSGDRMFGREIKPLDEGPKHVRMEMKSSGFMFEPLTPDFTRVTIIICNDPKMAIPPSLINFFTKNLAWVSMTMFRNGAKAVDEDSPYTARINANPALYKDLIEAQQTIYFSDPVVQQRVREFQAQLDAKRSKGRK